MTKFVTLIALLALSMLVIVPASAVNEYRDVNPANDVPDMSTYGYAQFYINAGGSAQDLTVYMQNVKQNLTFDSRWNPDRNDIEGQNGEWTKIQILPDGKSEKVLLSAGETFEACLRNGNGNQPECKRFIVGGADTTAVVFLGSAVTCGDAPAVCQREIVSATYGACKNVLVKEAWTEYKGDYKKVGNHYEYVGHNMADYDVTFHKDGAWGYYKEDNAGHYIYDSDGGWTWCGWRDVKVATEVGHVDHPAEYESDCDSGYTPVTQNVRDVVAEGHLSFIFDNRPCEGGIFATDGITLLSEIEDPAPGIKKHVSITYKDCSGTVKTIGAKEYEVINLT